MKYVAVIQTMADFFFLFLVCYQLIDSMFAQIEAASMKYADVIEMLLLMMADF